MVWSDHEIQKLAKHFVTVADEVYMLYPEDPGNLERVKDEPAHQLFKRFGESMPKGDWNHPGTKQGIYMLGPQGEYLEGRFAAGSDPKDILARLERALERWEKLRKEKKYANKPVPERGEALPPDVAGKPMVLRVSLRDLKSLDKPQSTPRWRAGVFDDAQWAGFMKWAWNQNWIAFDAPAAWVPKGKDEQAVPEALVQRLCREVLVDNVRGQAPRWEAGHVKRAELTMQRVGNGAPWRIEYRGAVEMDAGEQGYVAELLGEAEWDPKEERFARFELVSLGQRRGAWQFNQRENDKGPAPMGVALRLFDETQREQSR
jgi:hypothetical protein